MNTVLLAAIKMAQGAGVPSPSSAGAGFYSSGIGQVIATFFGDIVAPILILVGIVMFLKGFFGEKKIAKGLKALLACVIGAAICFGLAGGTSLFITVGITIWKALSSTLSTAF